MSRRCRKHWSEDGTDNDDEDENGIGVSIGIIGIVDLELLPLNGGPQRRPWRRCILGKRWRWQGQCCTSCSNEHLWSNGHRIRRFSITREIFSIRHSLSKFQCAGSSIWIPQKHLSSISIGTRALSEYRNTNNESGSGSSRSSGNRGIAPKTASICVG